MEPQSNQTDATFHFTCATRRDNDDDAEESNKEITNECSGKEIENFKNERTRKGQINRSCVLIWALWKSSINSHCTSILPIRIESSWIEFANEYSNSNAVHRHSWAERRLFSFYLYLRFIVAIILYFGRLNVTGWIERINVRILRILLHCCCWSCWIECKWQR